MKANAVLIFKRTGKIKLLIIVLLTSVNYISNAQGVDMDTLYYQNRLAHTLSTSEVTTTSSHFLGDLTGRKYAVVNDLYTYTVSSDVLNTGKQTMIDKPAIYNSVKKMNRYYRKLLKKNELSEDEVRERFNHVLDVAISVYTQSTEALENALRQVRKQDEIAEVFQRVVLR